MTIVQTKQQSMNNTENTNPLTVTLKDVHKQIPKELLQPPTTQNIVLFLSKLLFMSVFFMIAVMSSNIFLTIFSTMIMGVFVFSLGSIAHDCGHYSYARPKWLNEFIGNLSLSLHWTPYSAWRDFHDTHHKYTAQNNIDPDRTWLYEHEYQKMNWIHKKLWDFFSTKGFVFISNLHYFRVILPWAFLIHKKSDNVKTRIAVYRDIVITIALNTIIHSYLWSTLNSPKALFIHFAAVMVGFMCLSMYVRTQHYNLLTGNEAPKKPWLSSRSVTHSLFLDYISNNLNYHVEHHILQTLPHANLPQVQKIIKDYLKENNEHYTEEEFWAFLKDSFSQKPVLIAQ